MTRRKRIFIHDSVLSPQEQAGVDRVFRMYTQALCGAYPGRVAVYSWRRISADARRLLPASDLLAPLPISRYGRVNKAWGDLLAGCSSDIFYSPYYGQLAPRIPQVYSAYDMIVEKFPQYFPLSRPGIPEHIQEKKACFERAALVVCISEQTRHDILERYPHLPPDRFVAVHLGVDPLFFTPTPFRAPARPFFLFVGNRERYKNFSRLLLAYACSGLSGEFDLRVISPAPVEFTPAEQETIRRYRLGDRIRTEHAVSDAQLHEAYHQAFAFISPSEYEGFGLPVIEAMASGTVVLAARIPSTVEIAATVPDYFDPGSADEMIEVMRAVSQLGEPARQEKILAGRRQASGFTWQASQEKFLVHLGRLG